MYTSEKKSDISFLNEHEFYNFNDNYYILLNSEIIQGSVSHNAYCYSIISIGARFLFRRSES